MDQNLTYSYYFTLFTTIIPLLIIFPLSLIGIFGDSSSTLAFGTLISVVPLIIYFYLSKKALTDNSDYSAPLRITFYVNFLIFMVGVLISFNLIIIGSFLFSDQSPIGMDLEQNQAPYLVGLGVFIIIIASNGMYYLAKSKKSILH